MADLVTMVPCNPSDYEHVTKMGRVGQPNKTDQRSVGLRFRDLSFQSDYDDLPSERDSIPPPEPVRYKKEVRKRERDVQFTEMKLGRNMRAAPKGGIPVRNINEQLDVDASEPLLHRSTASSALTNPIVDYYTNTRALRTGAALSGSYFPSRALYSPQHPSQDLIEALNRNQQVSLVRASRRPVDDQREADLRQQRLEAELRRRREQEALQRESEAQRSSPELQNSPHDRLYSRSPSIDGDILDRYNARQLDKLRSSTRQDHDSDRVKMRTFLDESFPLTTQPLPNQSNQNGGSYAAQSTRELETAKLVGTGSSGFNATRPFSPPGSSGSPGNNRVSSARDARREVEAVVTVERLTLEHQETVETVEEADDITEDVKQEAEDSDQFDF